MSSEKFDKYVKKMQDAVKSGRVNLNRSQQETLYGLYKQGTIGKCNIPKPSGWFDLKGQAKWNAWSKLGDMSSDEAKSKYVSFAKGVLKNN